MQAQVGGPTPTRRLRCRVSLPVGTQPPARSARRAPWESSRSARSPRRCAGRSATPTSTSRKMTASVVAVVTDVVRDGRPVIGYGFNSNGRYAASGMLARPDHPAHHGGRPARRCWTTAGDNLDPHRIWATMMPDEKPGGHGERSVAVGAVDMAVWDAVAKIEEQAALPPAGRPLPRRRGRRRGLRLRRRRLLLARARAWTALQDEMRGYLDLRLPRRQDEDRRRAARRGSARASRRCWRWSAATASGWRSTPTAASTCATAIAYAGRCAPYGLLWYEEAGDPLDYALQAELAGHYAGPWRPARTCSRCRTPAT